MNNRRLALVTALVVLVGGVAAGIGYVMWPRSTEFDRAVAMLPEDTLRVTWTDWAGLRREFDADDVRPVGPAAEKFLLEVGDRDLSVSSLASSSAELYDALGFSPVTSEWELLGQGPEGMLLVLELDQDLGEIAERFADLGFAEPSSDAMDGGVWVGGPDVLARDTGLTTFEVQHVAFLEDEGLLVGSDNSRYLESALPAVTGDEDGLDAQGLTGQVEAPLAATMFAGDHACEALSMGQADRAAQDLGDSLVEQAGGVSPLKGYLVALEADHRVSLVFGFEDDRQAEEDLRSREALAGVEDPGQLVDYPDVFTVEDAEQHGTVVVLSGRASEDRAPMSNLTTGAVLLATC